MTTRQYFRTLNGQPPNMGLPPGTRVVSAPFPPQAPPVPASPPPYSANPYPAPPPDARLFLPPSASVQYIPYYIPIPDPPRPPPPAAVFLPGPAPTPAAAQVAPYAPSGGRIFGKEAPIIDGVGYLYPKQHTIFHVIDNAGMPLEQLVSPFQFEARMFPTSLSVKELIRALAPEGDDDEWGVTEMHEVGDDRWAVGQTILLSADLAKKTLGEMGWTEKRGTSAKPVWLKIHHLD